MTEAKDLVMWVVGAVTAITNAIFLSAFLLGRMWSRIERLEIKVEDHEAAIREFKGVV